MGCGCIQKYSRSKYMKFYLGPSNSHIIVFLGGMLYFLRFCIQSPHSYTRNTCLLYSFEGFMGNHLSSVGEVRWGDGDFVSEVAM